jgi:hypothetical protein
MGLITFQTQTTRLIERPILASASMGLLSPILSKFAVDPVYRGFLEPRVARFGHVFNFTLMVLQDVSLLLATLEPVSCLGPASQALFSAVYPARKASLMALMKYTGRFLHFHRLWKNTFSDVQRFVSNPYSLPA